MFFGEFQHSLDAKGRVILPAKFRDQLADGAFITSEIDGCLAVWGPEEFDVRVISRGFSAVPNGQTRRSGDTATSRAGTARTGRRTSPMA